MRCAALVASRRKKESELELTEGQKRAILDMFADGTSVRDLATWYRVDQATIRAVLEPHVKLVPADPRARVVRTEPNR
jgi:hypothetical protein